MSKMILKHAKTQFERNDKTTTTTATSKTSQITSQQHRIHTNTSAFSFEISSFYELHCFLFVLRSKLQHERVHIQQTYFFGGKSFLFYFISQRCYEKMPTYVLYDTNECMRKEIRIRTLLVLYEL